MKRREFIRFTAASSIAVNSFPSILRAQAEYPNRPIRLIIPFAPGGQTDILGRRFAQRFESQLGQAVVVDNKMGAGGVVGSSELVRANPDGYTLSIATSSTHSISPFLMPKLPYDPLKDFTPIALLAIIPMVIVVHPSVPAKNLKELIDEIKSQPKKYSYGTAGVGSINHLTGEMFKAQAGGLDLVHVPYKGSGQSVQDLIGGQIPILMATYSSVEQYHRSGQARIIVITSESRSSIAPDIPTAVESGLPKMISLTFNMLLGPPKLSLSTVNFLANKANFVMNDISFRKSLESIAMDPVLDSTPEKSLNFLKDQVSIYGSIIKSSGIKI